MLYYSIRKLPFENLGEQKKTSYNKVNKLVTEPFKKFWNIKNQVARVTRQRVVHSARFYRPH